MAAAFPGIDKLCIVVDVIEHLGVQMEVIDNNIRIFKTVQPPYGQKTYITGPGAD
jgi:hypothetical protein